MADEAEPLLQADEPEGEKKDNPIVVPLQAERDEHEEQQADVSLTPEQESYNLDLARAKLGVERFKAVYDKGDEEWKRLLTETELGEELQAMYLGLRPALSHYDENYEHNLALVMKNVSDEFGIQGNTVYDRETVARVLREQSPIFFDYSSTKMTVDEYMEQISQEEITDFTRARFGLLFGFPPHSVLELVRHFNIYGAFLDLHKDNDAELSSDERQLLSGYCNGSPVAPEASTREKHARVNKFRDEHQVEIKDFLGKRVINIPNETKDYLLTARFVDLPGFMYVSGNPNTQDIDFEQKVRDVFEQSGMNNLIASIKEERSEK